MRSQAGIRSPVLALWMVGAGVATGFWPRARIPVPAAVVGGLLAAFALWTALSTFWAESIEKSVNEANRAVLYLGVFALVVLSPDRGRHARRWIRGLAIGISAVALSGTCEPACSRITSTAGPREHRGGIFPLRRERA